MSKPTFTTDANHPEPRLTLTGDLNVQHGHEIKSFLLQTVEHTGVVHIDFNQATSLDVAAIQLTYAFKKQIELGGHKVTFSLPTNEGLLDLLTKTGITKIL